MGISLFLVFVLLYNECVDLLKFKLFTALLVLGFLGGVFPLITHADDSLPTVISTTISQTFGDAKGLFIIQNIGFSASPRVSITARACDTSSGCMSSDNPKFACRANRWVISTNGGMPPIRVPSPYPGAKAILVQVQGMTNAIRKGPPRAPSMEAGTYSPENGWSGTSLKDVVNVNMGDTVEMTATFSSNIAGAISGALGKDGGYVDGDGEMCGPGLSEATGDQMQAAMSGAQDWANKISDSIQAKIVWQVPTETPIQKVEQTIKGYEGIMVGGNKVSMPPLAPARSLLYQQGRNDLRTLAELHDTDQENNNASAVLAATKDFYGYALAAREGKEEADHYMEERTQGGVMSHARSFGRTFKLTLNRLMHIAFAADASMRWTQAGIDLQNALKIPFSEIDALGAIRHLAVHNVPVFVGFVGNSPDVELLHAAVILDYDPTRDMFIVFSEKQGIVKMAWDALMAHQPRFLVGTPE